ncbi:MAG: exodeoxyribonuclease VII small subunit [Planctomycetaceae bacterium]|nr:exodeoxyribonuclease VII small subunit [Planctomycetaceae bacterium]
MSKTTKAKRKTKPKKSGLSFEQCLLQLQQIVQQLEQGDLGLTESLQQYEEGVQHLKQCYQELDKAERRVELLSEIAEDGTAITEPFEESAMTLEEKAAARGSRRTRKKSAPKARDADSVSEGNIDGSPGLF